MAEGSTFGSTSTRLSRGSHEHRRRESNPERRLRSLPRPLVTPKAATAFSCERFTSNGAATGGAASPRYDQPRTPFHAALPTQTGSSRVTWRLLRPIWRVDNITASQRLVLLALASFTDQRGANAYPSQATLARMCCCSTRTVRRALADLIALKMIAPNGKGRGGTIRYAVNVLPTQDIHGHSPLTPMSYNPSKEIPSERNPSPHYS